MGGSKREELEELRKRVADLGGCNKNLQNVIQDFSRVDTEPTDEELIRNVDWIHAYDVRDLRLAFRYGVACVQSIAKARIESERAALQSRVSDLEGTLVELTKENDTLRRRIGAKMVGNPVAATMSDSSRKLLQKAIQILEDPPEQTEAKNPQAVVAFRRMLSLGNELSDRQYQWVASVVAGRRTNPYPEYPDAMDEP